jgi:predicted O-methyltransferase YrrM
MLLKQCLNPAYVAGRLHLALWERRNPNCPWMSQGAIRFLEGWLRKTDRGVEFGSGRSTCWFGQRVGQLTSIEHNREWFEIVTARIAETGLRNVDYHHIALDHPEEEPHRPFYDPLPRYVDFIRRFNDESLDFVIVDGHYRKACIEAALPKLKNGAMLILDNSDWLTLEEWGIPAHMRVVHRSRNVRSETTLFIKTTA